jgi:hypothetical protein
VGSSSFLRRQHARTYCGAAGWRTALQAGRSRVRFTMVLLLPRIIMKSGSDKLVKRRGQGEYKINTEFIDNVFDFSGSRSNIHTRYGTATSVTWSQDTDYDVSCRLPQRLKGSKWKTNDESKEIYFPRTHHEIQGLSSLLMYNTLLLLIWIQASPLFEPNCWGIWI